MAAKDIPGFVKHSFAHGGYSFPVMQSETAGPPVILLHEIFGVRANLIDFANLIAEAGFRVYLPVFFGSTDPFDGSKGKLLRSAQFLCVARQFRAFAQNDSGPLTAWLRHLADHVCAETGHTGCGIIGLCLTGNFALSAATNPKVKAPVMGEPSLPFRGKGLHLSPDEVSALHARDDLEVRAYRYATDHICKASHISRYETEFGDKIRATTIPTDTDKLHSVFTEDLRDADGKMRHDKVAEVIDFLRTRLAP